MGIGSEQILVTFYQVLMCQRFPLTRLQGAVNPMCPQARGHPTMGLCSRQRPLQSFPLQLSPCFWHSHGLQRSYRLSQRDAQAPVCGRRVSEASQREPCGGKMCSMDWAGWLGPGGSEQWDTLRGARCGTGAGNGQCRKDGAGIDQKPGTEQGDGGRWRHRAAALSLMSSHGLQRGCT